jgi:hypothetical protein
MPAPSTIVRGNGPRDGFPDYVVGKLKRDINGVLSGTVVRHFKVGPTNQRVSSAWLAPRNAPNPGWGIPCVESEAAVRDALAIVTYSYQGVDPGNPPIEDETTYELNLTMGSKSIKTHPAYAKLKEKYGWDDDTGTFAEYMPGSGDPLTGGFQGPSAPQRSPLAGVSDWYFVGVAYKITYGALVVPQNILGAIGTIITAPRGIGQFQLPAASKKRNWLVMAPNILKKGNASSVTEEYQLGEPGGFQKDIYSAPQLGETGGSPSNGFSGS